jgi:hypothetical protein
MVYKDAFAHAFNDICEQGLLSDVRKPDVSLIWSPDTPQVYELLSTS